MPIDTPPPQPIADHPNPHHGSTSPDDEDIRVFPSAERLNLPHPAPCPETGTLIPPELVRQPAITPRDRPSPRLQWNADRFALEPTPTRPASHPTEPDSEVDWTSLRPMEPEQAYSATTPMWLFLLLPPLIEPQLLILLSPRTHRQGLAARLPEAELSSHLLAENSALALEEAPTPCAPVTNEVQTPTQEWEATLTGTLPPVPYADH